MFSLMPMGHFELRQPPCQQIKARVDTPEHAQRTGTADMGAIDQQDASPAASHQPGRDRAGSRQHFLHQPREPGASSSQAFAPVGGRDIGYPHYHTPDAQMLKGIYR